MITIFITEIKGSALLNTKARQWTQSWRQYNPVQVSTTYFQTSHFI